MSNALPARQRREDAARELAARLATTAPLWRPPCFYDDPPWIAGHPRLAAALLALGDGELASLEDDPDTLTRWLADALPAIGTLVTAADACLDDDTLPVPLAVPETHGRDVPGRKWQQALAFAAACGVPHGPLVDWCCGKAHLGRLLSQLHGVPVTGIERNHALCVDGNALAARDRLPVQLVEADALTVSAPGARLDHAAHAVALHACGDLHLALLRTASDAGVAALDVAPCCYHLTRDYHWQPLSAALAACELQPLQLTRDDLRLAVQETVTASARVVAQTRQLAGWRLGFDALQRDVRGIDAALPTPSRPARVLADGFAAFCADMAAHHRLPLPAGVDYPRFEQLGSRRQARMRRLQLVRHACRRPLEVLLAADRALWLTERGYQVQLSPFCRRELTPRNLLLRARRRSAA